MRIQRRRYGWRFIVTCCSFNLLVSSMKIFLEHNEGRNRAMKGGRKEGRKQASKQGRRRRRESKRISSGYLNSWMERKIFWELVDKLFISCSLTTLTAHSQSTNHLFPETHLSKKSLFEKANIWKCFWIMSERNRWFVSISSSPLVRLLENFLSFPMLQSSLQPLARLIWRRLLFLVFVWFHQPTNPSNGVRLNWREWRQFYETLRPPPVDYLSVHFSRLVSSYPFLTHTYTILDSSFLWSPKNPNLATNPTRAEK